MLIIKDLLALPRCPCRCHCTGYYTGLDVARRQEAVYHPPRAPLNRQMDEADRDQTHVLRWTPLAGAPHRCFPELARAFVGPKPPNTEIQWHTRSLRRQSCRRNMVPQFFGSGSTKDFRSRAARLRPQQKRSLPITKAHCFTLGQATSAKSRATGTCGVSSESF